MVMFVPATPGPPHTHSLYTPSVAGAESNVAAYLHALGLTVNWISRVGEDSFGRFILDWLVTRGVDVSLVERDPSWGTGVAFKEIGDEGTQVTYFRSDSAFSKTTSTLARSVARSAPALIHTSGITLALSQGCRDFVEAVHALRGPQTVISFDVNWRPSLWQPHRAHTASVDAQSTVLAAAQSSDVVFVGQDEAEELWGVSDLTEIRRLVDEPRLLVVKRGSEGCTVFGDGEMIEVPALRVSVVEQVGAGDAFASGFLAGQFRRLSLRDSARLGTIVASSALSVSTDVGPLPSPAYVDSLMRLSDAEWASSTYSPASLGK